MITFLEDSTCFKMVYCNTGILALENEQVHFFYCYQLSKFNCKFVQYYDDILNIFFHILHGKQKY